MSYKTKKGLNGCWKSTHLCSGQVMEETGSVQCSVFFLLGNSLHPLRWGAVIVPPDSVERRLPLSVSIIWRLWNLDETWAASFEYWIPAWWCLLYRQTHSDGMNEDTHSRTFKFYNDQKQRERVWESDLNCFFFIRINSRKQYLWKRPAFLSIVRTSVISLTVNAVCNEFLIKYYMCVLTLSGI